MPLNNQALAEALEVYHLYWDSYMNGNLEPFASTLHEAFETIGTSETEVAHNKVDGIEIYKAQLHEIVGKVEMRNRQISTKPLQDMVLIYESCNIYLLNNSEWMFYSKLRLSTVLVETKTGWKIAQQHGSLPDIRVKDGETIALEHISKENLELRMEVKRHTTALEIKMKELAIETALEKVRSVAMGMKSPDDMLGICRVISEQLQAFGVTQIRNIQTAIIDEEKGIYLCYQYFTPYDKEVVERTAYHKSPVEKRMVTKMLASKDGHFTGMLTKRELEEFRDHRKAENQFPDPLLDETKAISHCFLSIGYGGLGLTLYETADVSTFDLFKRFHQVFSLAYRRFQDIQMAEARAREVEIDLALERVRAQTMAMHSSEDVGKCVVKMFAELTALGVDEGTRFGIGILNHDNEINQLWTAKKDGEEVKMHIGNLDMTSHPLLKSVRKAWKAQVPFHKYVLEGHDLLNYYQMLNHAPDYKIHIPIEKLPEKEIQHCFIFEHGFFYAFTPIEFQPDLIQITKRFSSLFEQTYRRYLDLVKAEAQAREAQIEAALERVRSRTMAMQHSIELSDTARLLFQQIRSLGVPPWSYGFNIWEMGDTVFTSYMGSPDGVILEGLKIPLMEEATFIHFNESRERGDALFIDILEGDTLEEHYSYFLSLPEIKKAFEKRAQVGEHRPTFQINHLANFSHGNLMFITYEPCPKAHDIFIRFAKVFEQTYTRFLDLQKAEAQARESQIEAAMEKVRSRSLAMQKPDELTEVAELLRKEMGQLGVEELETSSIYIINKEMMQAECWYAIKDIREENKQLVSDEMTITFADTWVGVEMRKFYQSKNEQASIIMKGDNRKEWINYCAGKSNVLQGYYGEEIPERTYHLLKFNGGYTGAASPGDISAESWDLLRRAASVFSLAYTRFNDLQIAAAHAEQAEQDLIAIKEAKQKAEEALTELQATQKQLIQSEKMASLGELTAGIAHEIQNPLNFVTNFSEVSKELIDEMKDELAVGSLQSAVEIADDIKQNLDKIHHHSKRADAIVKGMLQHSRTSTGQKEPTDINALCDEYLRLAYHGLKAKDNSLQASFRFEPDHNLHQLNIVPQDMGRVLLNLFNNAFYAVNERSRKGEAGYAPEVVVKTVSEGRFVKIFVLDNGGGIPEHIREKIFQPFFTTKPTGQGTGLGLSLSYDIVKAHGGELSVRTPLEKVETKEGEGSTFIIQIPVV